MKIISLPLASLHEDPSNARKHGDKNLAAIAASLAKFGQQRPIVIDKANVVVAGNGTLKAARSLGWAQIACVRTDLTGVQVAGFAIADNRSAELAEWDDRALAATLEALKAEDFDLGDVGFADSDLDALLKGFDEPAPTASAASQTRPAAAAGDPTGPAGADAAAATVATAPDALPPEADGKAFDESVADDVPHATCPRCGYLFPR
jgi:ParB-like chromosome segregation protein Spo0J